MLFTERGRLFGSGIVALVAIPVYVYLYLNHLRAPLLNLAVGFWILLTMLGRYWEARTQAPRLDDGRCQHCGYDLRATPDRCPECGAVPPPVA
jgi:hypothetical protein